MMVWLKILIRTPVPATVSGSRPTPKRFGVGMTTPRQLIIDMRQLACHAEVFHFPMCVLEREAAAILTVEARQALNEAFRWNRSFNLHVSAPKALPSANEAIGIIKSYRRSDIKSWVIRNLAAALCRSLNPIYVEAVSVMIEKTGDRGLLFEIENPS